jgi:hypothetical protein
LAWDGKESEDDVVYTPPQSPVKEDSSYNSIIKPNSFGSVWLYAF